MSHIQQLTIGYWGVTSTKTQSMLSHGLASPRSKDATVENQQPVDSGVGRSWVQSMFSRDRASRSNSFSRVRRWTSDGGSSGIFVAKIRWLYDYVIFFHYLPSHDHDFMSYAQLQMRMELLVNKIYQLLGKRELRPVFAYVGVTVARSLLYIVLQGERFGILWVTVKMQVSL